MDGAQAGWYFSMVAPNSRRPALVRFARAKYARPLLVDAGYISTFHQFDRDGQPHALDFHDILLVTRGTGRVAVDGETHALARGVLVITRPGQVRQWLEPPAPEGALDGACVFFKEEFLAEAFRDPYFVGRFSFFRTGRPAGSIRLTRTEHRRYLDRFGAMRTELAALATDATDALRAGLYDLLVTIDRFYQARHGSTPPAPPGLVDRFRARVERDFRRCHEVAGFAAALGVTPGHLTARCRAALGQTASAVIHARLVLEAKRQLRFSDLGVAEIAYGLGFDDPAYFARFFRREVGLSPGAFRKT